ncbi:plasmid mobilization protein, partial [Streptomyces tibetensis]
MNIRDIISLKINKKIQLTERFLPEFWKLSFNVDYTQLLAKLQQESRFIKMFKRENRDEIVRLRVTTEEKEILKKFAQEKDLTMSAVIAQALDNYLDATVPKDFEQMEVYYNGKKDKALTRKA